MSIRARILLLIMMNILLFVGIGVANISLYLNRKNALAKTQEDLKLLSVCLNIEEAMDHARREEKNFMLFQERQYLNLLKGAIEDIHKHLMELQNVIVEYPDFTRSTSMVSEALEKYKSLVDTLPGMTKGEFQQFTVKTGKMTVDVKEKLDEIEKQISIGMEGRTAQFLHVLQTYTFFTLGGLSTAILIWLFMGFWFWFRVRSRLDKLAASAVHIMRGDYQPVVEPGPLDEVGQLALAFDEMRQKIQEREERIEKLNADLIKLTNQLKRG